MRILVAIPHYYAPSAGDSTHRSSHADARAERSRALGATILALHASFGTHAFGLDHGQKVAWGAERAETALDIVVCTTGQAHLLAEIVQLSPLVQLHETDADPLLLGFECHKVLASGEGRYDVFAYVEDDIVVGDPGFFDKLAFCNRQLPAGALLQPNRYELSDKGPYRKLYVDYRLRPEVTSAYQDIADAPRLALDFAGRRIDIERTSYPSAGCFFLDQRQLERWIAGPHFLDGDVSFLTPLDSAATLSVMRTFKVYKPALAQASFLEVLHASPRWIDGVEAQVSTRPLAAGDGG